MEELPCRGGARLKHGAPVVADEFEAPVGLPEREGVFENKVFKVWIIDFRRDELFKRLLGDEELLPDGGDGFVVGNAAVDGQDIGLRGAFVGSSAMVEGVREKAFVCIPAKSPDVGGDVGGALAVCFHKIQ